MAGDLRPKVRAFTFFHISRPKALTVELDFRPSRPTVLRYNRLLPSR